MLEYPKHLKNQNQPSLISSLYKYWQQYKVPAIFYHYTLSILAQKSKEDQKMFMNKEIKLLRLGTHPYHIITDLIVSRQQSLQAITKNVECLNAAPKDHSFLEQNQYQREYSMKSKNTSRVGHRFVEFINNIKIYRKMTMQVVFRIFDWAKQLHHNQYKGIIQFIFKHQDYLQKILIDTKYILKQNQYLFQNNPLLILKKEHQNTQNGLIFKYLKINEDQAKKIESTLQIITTHHAIVENKRLLGIYKSTGSRKTLKEIDHFDKIFCNFNKSTFTSKNYKTVEVSNQSVLKSSRSIVNHEIYSDLQSTGIQNRESPLKIQSKLLQLGRSQSQVSLNRSFYKQPKTNHNLIIQPPIPTQFDISFQFQTGIEVTQIYNYLRNNIFKNQNIQSRQIETVTKNVIKYKDFLSFINIKVGQLLVGWIAVILNPKDQLYRRVADIIHLYKFMKVPTMQQAIINHFLSLGYGIVKLAGQIIYEGEHKYRKVFNLITISWQVKEVKRDRLKKVIKDHSTLKGSRVLKYYSYSSQTKYHKYCVHQQNLCKLQFKFDVVTKVYIQSNVYYRVKCDRVKRKGQLLIVQNHLNELQLILSKKLQGIINYEKNNSDISYQISKQTGKDEQITYVCFPQTKSIKKYVNRDQEDIILLKLQINQTTTEVLSVSMDRNTINNYIVVDSSYLIALACNNEEDYGKTVAIVFIK